MSPALLIIPVLLISHVAMAREAAAGDTHSRNYLTPPDTLLLDNVPPVDETIARDMADYTDIKSTSFVTWYGDSMIVSYRNDNVSQLFLIDRPRGELQPLTDFPEPVTSAVASPDAGFIVFRKDEGGNEQYQLHRLDVAASKVTPLTAKHSRTTSYSLDHEGKRLAYSSNERDGKHFDVYVMDPMRPGSAKRVYTATRPASTTATWSYDGQYLLVTEYLSAAKVYSHLLDVNTGAVRSLTPDDGGYFKLTEFTVDGRYLLGLSDQSGEFRRLIRYDVKTGQTRVISQDIPWDVAGTFATGDGHKTLFSTNENGISRLYLLDNRTFDYEPIAFATGIISGYEPHPDGDRMALTFSSARNNGNVYVRPLTGNGTAVAWTLSDTGGLDLDRFVDPELVTFPTFDQVDGRPRQISAFYYRPQGSDPHPLVIVIHGGPESQFRPGFLSPAINYWINELHIGVIAPNVRGSSGYGKTYLSLDNGVRREDSVRDIGALIDWARAQPQIDADRIAVSGGSYGGYMVLAAMIRFGDKLAAGYERVGISNFVTFLKNTSDYRRDLRRAEYGDERVIGEFLERISPNRQADKIRKPLLIIQGAQDPRVPLGESEQMVATLKQNNTPVWYIVGKNEGHGFRKKDNRDYQYYTAVNFWKTFLLPRN